MLNLIVTINTAIQINLMKRLLIVLFLFPSLIMFGQQYKLFNRSSIKLFTTSPVVSSTCGISLDSAVISGSDSVYFNYTALGEYFESDTCVFWGGPYCIKQDRPLWFGNRIVYDNLNKYKFFTIQEDTVIFDFDLQLWDSSLIFQDVNQQFYMKYIGDDTSYILNFQDSLKYYKILHYNTSGQVINSPLNNKNITIGKDFGMLGFFRIDSFPAVLQPIQLIGNINPQAGISCMNNENLYDHQPGDVIQYTDRFHSFGYPSPWDHSDYIKHTFLERNDTQDSIFYTVERVTYNVDTNYVIQDTISLKYYKYETVETIPFNKINQQEVLRSRQFYWGNYCDFSAWTHKKSPIYLVYCAEDNCWGEFDTNGTPPIGEIIYVYGLGLYRESSYITGPNGSDYLYEINYFIKDGVECGEEIVVDIHDAKFDKKGFKLYPNPVKDELNISYTGKETLNGVRIYNIHGQLLQTENRIENRVNVSMLTSGIYIIELYSGNSKSWLKFIKE